MATTKQRLDERDLLVMAVDQPKYLSKALGHDCSEGTGLETPEQKKEMTKYFYKAWSGLTKYLLSQVQRQRSVDFPLVGRFVPRQDLVVFVPHLDFIASGKFSFP